MKKLFKSYSFWAAFSCAIAVFLEDFSNLLNLDINVSLIESLIMSFCGVLVVLGIVNKKEESKDAKSETSKEISEEILKNIESDNDTKE